MQSILLFSLLITLYPLACLWLQPANNNKRLIMYNWLEIRVKNDHRSKFSNLSNWKIYCDDHSSLSSTTAVQKWIISYTSHHDSKLLLFYDKVNPLDYSKIVLWGRVFWLGTKPPTCYGIHSTKVSGENFKELGELTSTFDYLHEFSSKDIKIDMANVGSDCFNPFSSNFWKPWHMETKIKNNRIKANFWKEPMCPDEDSPVEENMVHLYQWGFFSKLFQLDTTDSFSFGPKVLTIWYQWIFHLVG